MIELKLKEWVIHPTRLNQTKAIFDHFYRKGGGGRRRTENGNLVYLLPILFPILFFSLSFGFLLLILVNFLFSISSLSFTDRKKGFRRRIETFFFLTGLGKRDHCFIFFLLYFYLISLLFFSLICPLKERKYHRTEYFLSIHFF